MPDIEPLKVVKCYVSGQGPLKLAERVAGDAAVAAADVVSSLVRGLIVSTRALVYKVLNKPPTK